LKFIVAMTDKLARTVKSMPKSPFYAILDYVAELGLDKEVIYLNQGEPHFLTPPHIREAAKKAVDGNNPYTPQPGIPELCEAIAKKLKVENAISVDPGTEVFVTSGAQAALYAALQTLINPGDEIIVPSPYYPPYVIDTQILNGKAVIVPFGLGESLTLDPEEIEKDVTDRTKALLIHSPNNPTGGVLSRENLKAIAEVAVRHQLPVITDECYEKILFDGAEHVSMASLPGMRDQTITISSFSKTFSMTGWRVGYLAASADFVKSFAKIHHTINICANSIAQRAAYAALTGPRDFWADWYRVYETNRKILVDSLKDAGVRIPARATGTFYVMIDITGMNMNSEEACRFFVREAKIVLTPGSGFGPQGEGYVRMSYATQTEKVTLAAERITGSLKKLKRKS